MGIRINKQIGYFLSNEKISTVLIKDYENILEQLKENSDWEKQYFESLEQVAKEVLTPSEYSMAQFELRFLKSTFDKKEIKFHKLISDLYLGDDSQGLLFKTEEMVKSDRRDDLIDYYDNFLENNIKYLYAPIYPSIGYVYHGGLENYDIYPKLEVGEEYAQFVGHIARAVNKHIYSDERNLNTSSEIGKILTEKGYFTPCINPCMYVLAKTAGIVQDTISHVEFNRHLEAVIATTWD